MFSSIRRFLEVNFGDVNRDAPWWAYEVVMYAIFLTVSVAGITATLLYALFRKLHHVANHMARCRLRRA